MKKRISILLMMTIILLTGCQTRQPVYHAGIYIGNSEGYYSNITVAVTVDEYRILDIEILSHDEIKILADIVFDELPPRIIKKNGTDVESISGATYTSESLIRAVDKALEPARIDGGDVE